MVNRFASSA